MGPVLHRAGGAQLSEGSPPQRPQLELRAGHGGVVGDDDDDDDDDDNDDDDNR